jgi:hypothetical protein
MPMPYYIFSSPSQNLKPRRGDVSSAPASLLHLRSRPPPCSAVLLCVPLAEAQCARAWPRVGVPVRLPVGLPLPPALVPPTGPEPPCVNKGALSSSAPASCCNGSSPEFRQRGPYKGCLLNEPNERLLHQLPLWLPAYICVCIPAAALVPRFQFQTHFTHIHSMLYRHSVCARVWACQPPALPTPRPGREPSK